MTVKQTVTTKIFRKASAESKSKYHITNSGFNSAINRKRNTKLKLNRKTKLSREIKSDDE